MRKVIRGIVCLILASCTNGTLVHQYETVDNDGWVRADTIYFDLPAATETGDYGLSVAMRYANSFPYEGIWIIAEGKMKKPTTHWRDTLYFRMADNEGIPMGHGVVVMQNDTLVRTMHMQKGQNGSLRIWHIMRREVMPSVREVGIKVKRVN